MYVLAPNQSVEKYPYSFSQLRQDNPQTSYPQNPSDGTLAGWGIFPVKPTTPPQVNYTQNLSEVDPVLVDGEWQQLWSVSPASPEEVQERLDNQWVNVRDERNQKLASCDWTQLPDAPVDAAIWATYRQALRDVTQQPDPFAIVWPVPPA